MRGDVETPGGRSEGDAEAPPRVVVDTNILVGAAYRPGSASGRVVAACLGGRLLAVVSPAIVGEYRRILTRAVRGPSRPDVLGPFLDAATTVEPVEVPAVVAADPADDALFAAAVAGNARAIVTNDRPVLDVVRHGPVRVLRPADGLAELLGEPIDPTGRPNPLGKHPRDR